jgi:hypothetical protein
MYLLLSGNGFESNIAIVMHMMGDRELVSSAAGVYL